MLARFPRAGEAIDGDRRVTAAEAEVARLRPAAAEDLSRVKDAVNVLARNRQVRTTDETVGEWLRENASATHAEWDGWLEENAGGKHLFVAYRAEHYVGRQHLFDMALEVVRAYHHLNADYAGSVGVEVRHLDSGDRSLAVAASWDLGDGFHRRFSPGGAAPAPCSPVTGFVIGPAGEVFANQAGALLVSDVGGTNWRRDDGPTARIEALFAAGGGVYGRGYGARALVARGPSGAWGAAAAPPDHALVASAFLGELSTPDIDPRIGQGNEADGRRDITDITTRGEDVYGVSDGAVTLRDAVYPIPAWRVVVTPNSVNFPGAEAAFRARYTETVIGHDWLLANGGIREATLATMQPPPELDWQHVRADSGGWVDLQDQLQPAAPNGLTTAYMVCYVDAPDARRVALNTMRTGALGVWVNGRRIPDAWDVGDEYHDNTISIPLRAGRNALMIKLGRLGNRWGVQARLLPEGAEGVRVAAELRDLGKPLAPVTGDVWVHVNHMLTSRNVHALHVGGDRLYAATHGDVWVFSAGELRWTRLARGVVDGPNVAYALTTHDGAVYSARKGGIYRLDPDTHVWEARSAGLDDRHVRAIASAGGVLLAGTHQGHIYLSADDGRNWERVHGAAPSLRL
ncbi:hypothetical protein CMK11_17370 [Candidatus Poribacteria bacterium]|nr:hypothetical protein [Candidatus Poribacteria bacterium]